MGGNRFTALDSWRGIAACMVVLFHVRANSHISDLELVRNAYLFVDFFFVLSGFVIAATYGERLAGGFSIWRFMLLRFGRIYPLHLAVLVAFVGLELVRGLGQAASPLSAPDALAAILAHLLLIHGLGVFDTELWNVPSWSISTEFFTYLAFALAVSAIGPRIKGVLIAVLLLFPVMIYVGQGSIDARGYEMMRCLYGFGAGAMAWHLFHQFRGSLPAGTLAEALAIGAVAWFVSAAGVGPWSIGAPIIFAAVVVIFASQSGAASRLLARKPFLLLGTVSYSIYMVHFLVARRVVEGLGLAKAFGIRAVDYLATDKWAGDVLVLLCLMIVVTLSTVTYRFIEVPARDWFKRMALRPEPPRALAQDHVTAAK